MDPSVVVLFCKQLKEKIMVLPFFFLKVDIKSEFFSFNVKHYGARRRNRYDQAAGEKEEKMDLYLKNDQLRDLDIGSGRGRRIACAGR